MSLLRYTEGYLLKIWIFNFCGLLIHFVTISANIQDSSKRFLVFDRLILGRKFYYFAYT